MWAGRRSSNEREDSHDRHSEHGVLEGAHGDGHRSRRFHRQPPHRAAGGSWRQGPRLLRVQLERLARLARRIAGGRARGARHPARRHPRRALRGACVPRRGYRLPSRRTDRHPVQLCRPGELRRHEREGHAARARGRAARRVPPPDPDVHERGVRDTGERADPRDASAPGAIALQRHQGCGRQAVRGVLLLVRHPGGDIASVQHVWATTVHARRAADTARAVAGRQGRDQARPPRHQPRPDLCERHGGGLPACRRGRWGGR